MLNLELRSHGELSSLLDLEWVILKSLLGASGGEVDDHVGTAGRGHGEGEDDAVTGVGGIAEVFTTAAETKGFFVALEGFVVGILTGVRSARAIR